VAAKIRSDEQVPAPDRWGEVFGDDVVAAAMIDRLVHHAEVIALKGDSYRLKDRDLGRVPAATTDET
jgi:DNA replication protein DnaC